MDDAAPSVSLQKRLVFLRQRFAQAEIARKTGFSRNNVSRYMRGTRVPLDFGSALVTGLGVNPAWLLSGAGTALLADVTADTGQMAGNLLELVEAMDAVAQMRLGSLAGKEHAKMLRELNEALLRHEALRSKLNARSREIFRQLLADVRAALGRMDLRRAVELLKAAEQVSRLSDDEELMLDFKALQAHVLFMQRHDDEALKLQRQVFMRTVLRAESFNEESCAQVLRFALMLNEHTDGDDALRVARAGIALCDQNLRKTQIFAELSFFAGNLLALRGDLHKGLAIMQRYLPLAGERRALVGRTFVVRTQLLAGLMDLPTACTAMPPIPPGGEVAARFAMLTENPRDLEAALKFASNVYSKDELGDSKVKRHLDNLLAVSRGGQPRVKAAAYFSKERPEPGARAFPDVFDYAYFGQLGKALGEHAASAALLGEAHACLLKYPRLRRADFMIAGTTYRTVMQLPESAMPPALRKYAAKFIERHVRKGFLALAQAISDAKGRPG
ncbi:MAG: hypothetical protein IT462_18065 [Planctomycetes bacterium]|nr:hypothetical protein [Planctomycetota bacterium]